MTARQRKTPTEAPAGRWLCTPCDGHGCAFCKRLGHLPSDPSLGPRKPKTAGPRARTPSLAYHRTRARALGKAGTQAVEAASSGVSVPTWKRWEACTASPSDEQAAAIAERYGVTLAALRRKPTVKQAVDTERANGRARRQLARAVAHLVALHGKPAVLAAVDS
jgi:hypothetical protein